jgi:hypothetical protein
MSHTMGWAAAGVWFCGLFAVGCAGIAFATRPHRHRNRRIHDAGRTRRDERDFLAQFYRINGRNL